MTTTALVKQKRPIGASHWKRRLGWRGVHLDALTSLPPRRYPLILRGLPPANGGKTLPYQLLQSGEIINADCRLGAGSQPLGVDRKSTRLNSSHLVISYAVFCLKKKKKK